MLADNELANTLSGNDGANTLRGLGGSDILKGGDGRDTLTGTLHAEDFYVAAGATKAHDATDRLIYNTTTGVLYYDADGLGGASAVQVAQLGSSTHPAFAYGDLQIVA